MKTAVYSCFYNMFLKADESELSKFLNYEWIYKPTSVKVWNTDAEDWDWVPIEMAVYSDYYGIHIIKKQAVFSKYYCAYIFEKEAEYSNYLNSYVDKRDKDLVRINGDYVPKVKFDGFVYSSICGKYIPENSSVYSQYHETYIFTNDAVYSNFLESYILNADDTKVWNTDINDWDYVPNNMAVFCPYRGYNIIKYQSRYSDMYEQDMPVDHIAYSYEVDSYVDERDPRFTELLTYHKDFRGFYPQFVYTPKTYLNRFKNRERNQDIFVIFNDGNRSYIQAIVTFINEEKYQDFISVADKKIWLKDKLNIDEEYFANTNIDIIKEYINGKDDEQLIWEIDRADFYIIE
jgi:hypothetical protein